ncbi:TMEM165/GDT1 family protein [Capilliphycus salinus ALCB114379]|uniref:TMEM165/GDT1 family protein n=1 Tax=Capilliphycus salinus TaxID=2768948 RepID=UPI0039A545B1
MTPSSELLPSSNQPSNFSQESSPELPTDETTEAKSQPQESPNSQPTQPRKPKNSWAIFVSTFITIFLAEIGDKTQLTTLLMTAESHKPWVVFAGAGSALVLTSLLGVLVGRWLSNRIEPKTLERAAGITLLVISCLLFWETFQ